MKKRIIWFVVFLVLVALVCVVAFTPAVFNAVKSFAAEHMTGLYDWAKDKFYSLYEFFRYGKAGLVVVVAILALLIMLFTTKVGKVPEVSDDNVAPINVTQKAYVQTKDQKATVVVVEESEAK